MKVDFLSIVVPVYNEQNNLIPFYNNLIATLVQALDKIVLPLNLYDCMNMIFRKTNQPPLRNKG